MLHKKVYKLNTVEHCCIPVANSSTYVVSWKLLYTSVIMSSCKVKRWVKCPWINTWKRVWICFIYCATNFNTLSTLNSKIKSCLNQKLCLPKLFSFPWPTPQEHLKSNLRISWLVLNIDREQMRYSTLFILLLLDSNPWKARQLEHPSLVSCCALRFYWSKHLKLTYCECPFSFIL